MSVSLSPRSPSAPAPVRGLFSCGFEVGRLPHPEGFAFTHGCDPSHRFLSLPSADWYGRWSVQPWRPEPGTVPSDDIVVLKPRPPARGLVPAAAFVRAQ